MNNILDANAILRYLLCDNQEQANKVEEIIKNGAYTISEVICEVIYVLEGYYKLDKIEICDSLLDFLDEIDVNDKQIIIQALKNYKKLNIDYVDCILLSRKQIYDEDIISFDKKLLKTLNK